MVLYRLELKFPEELEVVLEPAVPTPDWLRSAFDAGELCRRCGQVGRALYPEPLSVRLAAPVDEAGPCLIQLQDTGVVLFSRVLLDLLAPHLSGFVHGDVLGPDGTPLERYQTCYTGHRFTLRNTLPGAPRTCDVCGSPQDQTGSGREYTHKTELQGGEVQQDRSGRLYIGFDLHNALGIELPFAAHPVPIQVRD